MNVSLTLVNAPSNLLSIEKLNKKIDKLKFVKEVFSNISHQECEKANEFIENGKKFCKSEKIIGALLTVVAVVASVALIVLLTNPISSLLVVAGIIGLNLSLLLGFTGFCLLIKNTLNMKMHTPNNFDKEISIGRDNKITIDNEYGRRDYDGYPLDSYTHYYRYDHKSVEEFIHKSTKRLDDKENICVNDYLNNYLVSVERDDNSGKSFYLKSLINKLSADIIEATEELQIKRAADKKNMIVNLHEGNFKVLPIEVTKLIEQLTVKVSTV